MANGEQRRQDFLWIVQTFMLRDTKVTGWHGHVGDAVAASYRIPAGKSARDAAVEFWGFFSEDFRGDEQRHCPVWMSALKDPAYT